MPKQTMVRNIVDGVELKEKIDAGVNKIFNVALASYGVNSGNVLIEHRYGEPLVSHDGITNISKLVVDDPIENMVISIVRQASEKTNRDAGDATTLTVVLTKLAYDHLSKLALTPRRIQAQTNGLVADVKAYIEKNKVAITDETLRGVSRVSAGDPAIGDMVADAVKTAGKHGGITVVETINPTISSEVIDGLTFKKGLKAVALANDIQALKSRFDEPAVIVMSKLISRNDDIVPVLDKMLMAGRNTILLIADVSGQALETIIDNKLKGRLDIAIVEPQIENRDVFLRDVAQYASTKVFAGVADEFDVEDYSGSVDSAYITLSETTINGCKTPDELAAYVADIKDDKRLEMLNGKTVKISVGAPTQVERQEMKLRIEDAVCAAQTAQDYGVVPGGGVFLRDMFREMSEKDKHTDSDVVYFTRPFAILTGDPEASTVGYKPGAGVNIYTDKNIDDMVAAGIVDSAKAIEEAVVNAHSAAVQLVSITMALPYVDSME